MFQASFRPPRPNEEWVQKSQHPYTFGPHVTAPNTDKKIVFYYPAHNAIITTHPHTIHTTYNDPPAWLVAQWIVAKSQGIPISRFAEQCLQYCSDTPILNWFSNIKGVDLNSHNSPDTNEHNA
mgnify:CR=1 FL=1